MGDSPQVEQTKQEHQQPTTQRTRRGQVAWRESIEFYSDSYEQVFDTYVNGGRARPYNVIDDKKRML